MFLLGWNLSTLDSETKQQSIVCRHSGSPRGKNFVLKNLLDQGRTITGNIFGDNNQSTIKKYTEKAESFPKLFCFGRIMSLHSAHISPVALPKVRYLGLFTISSSVRLSCFYQLKRSIRLIFFQRRGNRSRYLQSKIISFLI